MATSRAATANPTTTAEEPGGTTPPPTTPPPDTPTPTITHYQQIAAEFMAALDEISQIIPKLAAAHVSTVNLVRSRLNVPNQFLATVTAAVVQVPELQAMRTTWPKVSRAIRTAPPSPRSSRT